MNDLTTIWSSLAKGVANIVNANIGSQLADSAKSLKSVGSPSRNQVYPKSHVRQPDDDPMSEIREMFQRLMERTHVRSGPTTQTVLKFIGGASSPRSETTKPRTEDERHEETPQRRPFWSSWMQSPVPPKIEKPQIIISQGGTSWNRPIEAAIDNAGKKSRDRASEITIERHPIERQKSMSLSETVENKLGSFFKQFDRYSAKFLNNIGFGKIAHDPDDEMPERHISEKQKQAESQSKPETKSFTNTITNTLSQVLGKSRAEKARDAQIEIVNRNASIDKLRTDYSTKVAKRDELGSKIGTSAYQEMEHRAAIKAASAAQLKLNEATSFDAKATISNAAASTKVAQSVGGLGGVIGRLVSVARSGTAIGAAAAAVYSIMRAPWSLRDMATSRLEYLERQGEYQGRGAALGAARYAQTTGNIEALNARDTAASTVFMVDQLNQLRQNLRPLSVGFTNLTNDAMGGGMMMMNKWAEMGGDVANYMKARFMLLKQGNWNPDQKQLQAVLQQITDAQAQKAEKDKEVANQMGTQTAGAMVATIDMRRKQREEARKNAKPRKPLAPLP